MSGPQDALTMTLAGEPVAAFHDAPAGARALLEHQLGPLVVPDTEAPVRVRFEALHVAAPLRVLEAVGPRARVDDVGRVFLADGGGRLAELPGRPGDADLQVDPAIDVRLFHALHQLTDLLLERHATAAGMPVLKGACARLRQGTVAVVGFAGSGKTTLLLWLLEQAEGYLAEERLVLHGGGRIAGYPSPVRLGLGRSYVLPDAVWASLTPSSRAAFRVAHRAATLPGRLAKILPRVVDDRWAQVDLVAAFPGLQVETEGVLDAIVFLEPTVSGELDVRPIGEAEVVARAEAHVRYLHERTFGTLRDLIAYGRQPAERWEPELPATTVPAALGEVPGWAVRVPRDVEPRLAAQAIRRLVEDR